MSKTEQEKQDAMQAARAEMDERAALVSIQPKRLFSDDDLLAIQHGGYQTALQAMQSKTDVVDSSDLLASFDVLNKNEKDVLVGKPFLILEWRFNPSNVSVEDFVSCVIMTEDEHLYILNDGSTGIRQQLLGITDRTGRQSGLACKKGLRRSDYTVEGEDGKEIAASTYYIA